MAVILRYSSEFGSFGANYGEVWFIPLADVRVVCR